MLHQICIKYNIYWLISCIYVATLIKKNFHLQYWKSPRHSHKIALRRNAHYMVKCPESRKSGFKIYTSNLILYGMG